MTDRPTDDDGWGDASGDSSDSPKDAKTPTADKKPIERKPPALVTKTPKAAATKTAKPKPEPAKPVAAKPVAAKPVAAKPVAAKPVAAKPVAAKPVAAKPAAAKPAAAKPAAAKPAPPKLEVAKPAATASSPSATAKPPSTSTTTASDRPVDDSWKMPPPSDLLDAVGVGKPPPPPPPPDGKPKRERPPFSVLAKRAGIVLAIALFIAGVVKSYLNTKNLYVVCGDSEVTAERGSWLPPWGTTRISGDRFAPIPNPPGARCVSSDFDDMGELELYYLGLLLERADELLENGEPELVDKAAKELEQALLLARDPARTGNQRRQIDQLQGDVSYWRGTEQFRALAGELSTAATAFDEASKRGPRHSRDASSWATFARKLADEISKGPPDLRPEQPGGTQPTPPTKATPPPTGVDAGPAASAPDAGIAAPKPARHDAGLPAGILL